MFKKQVLLLFAAVCLLAFKGEDKKTFEFAYPKLKGSDITMQAGHFKKFDKEWRGSDYYYMAQEDGFICSVLYYKLNKDEVKMLVEVPKAMLNAPDISPAYPYTYFKEGSNLKSMEKDDTSWGKAEDDFMFRQNNITMSGFTQKHMYGYAMVNKDLFVNIHISKVGCSPADSTEMVDILRSLAKKK